MVDRFKAFGEVVAPDALKVSLDGFKRQILTSDRGSDVNLLVRRPLNGDADDLHVSQNRERGRWQGFSRLRRSTQPNLTNPASRVLGPRVLHTAVSPRPVVEADCEVQLQPARLASDLRGCSRPEQVA